ncbi:MAG: FAD-dependent oxidoreductase [Acidobacteria bacterium]|nr:FAD-dependent oxidoreductase [Acidobacteriota bacterium]
MDRHARAGILLLLAALTPAAEYTLVDVQKVPVSGDPSSAIVRAIIPDKPAEITCDILVAGGGMGGVAAALAIARHNRTVCMTEETDWIGGQATSGGVSALDENRFIEFTGGTRSYYEFRNGIRKAYGGKANPGNCYVSQLCFEPRIGVNVLQGMLAGKPIRTFLRTQIVALEKSGEKFTSALAWQFDKREALRFRFKWILDATEMGDLLPLSGLPYVVGSEAKADTKEPHAAEKANTACVQSFTYPFAIERRDGESHTIPKPADYDAIRKRQDFTLRMNYPTEYGWKGLVEYTFYGEDAPVPNNMSPRPFFRWRRLRAGNPQIALMNWPRQDYAAESILDRTPADTARILQEAKRTSLAFLYWMQNDLQHPEVKLRPDIMGTTDGFSKYPYVRESRRLIAQGRVVEQDIVEDYQNGPRARRFRDSVGTGFYMVDIHPCGANERGRMMMPKPFQIPMSTLLPKVETNFLPAGKTLGVTHLTNGAFRLHPIEWMIGEAAGTIASLAIAGSALPEASAVQEDLARAGVPIFWFDDLRTDHSAFAAIQLAAVRNIYPLFALNLHASPDAPMTRAEAAMALTAFFRQRADRDQSIRIAIEKGWMATDHRNWFHPDLPVLWTDLREDKMPHPLPKATLPPGPITRAAWARRLTNP